jgi:manganese oxidase
MRNSTSTACFVLLVLAFGGCTDTDPTVPIDSSESRAAAAPRTRVYYIAADEMLWHYTAPGATIDLISGLPFAEHPDAGTFVIGNGDDRIGASYYRMLYREYADASFTTLKSAVDPQYAATWAHLGSLGPAIQAQVGDTIRVVFRNNTARPVSVHPHGVFYDKNSEGAPYCDSKGCSPGPDDAVASGATVIYTWPVPPRAGPGPNDGSSILWMYHSHVDEVKDTNAGLVGPIIITARGKIRDDGQPIDVDREFVLLFTVADENENWLLDRNIAEFAPNADTEDDEFIESNLMHSINGRVYGYLPLSALTMRTGERVRWYLLGMGTEVDLHTAHWHGQTGLFAGMRTDIIELLPASMKVFDMEPDNVGTWLLHCHVNDHIRAGMMARFDVLP